MKKSFYWSLVLVLFAQLTWAGRPVFHTVNRDELISKSDFIFDGYPSPQKAKFSCPHETGRWQVHKVLRGDKSLEGSIISIADHGYKYFYDEKGNAIKPPSFAASIFRDGKLNRDSSSSFLFTTKNKDGCFELVAQGAQESSAMAPEIESLLAPDPIDCSTAMRGLNYRINSFSKSCTQDSDCELAYLHPYNCEKPYVLSKIQKNPIDTAELISLQNKVREGCGKDWGKHGPCSPIGIPYRCQNSKCEEGMTAAVAGKIKFETATANPSCAPHDASSMQISIRKKGSDYPVISINWWTNGTMPTKKGGSFSLDATVTNSLQEGFQVGFCSFKGNCQFVKKVKLSGELAPNTGQGKIKFSIQTEKDESLTGEVPITISFESGMPCG